VIGRFISPDTQGIDLANPQTLNRYSYCANNPLNRTDPTGHFALKSFLKTALKVAAAVVMVAAVVTVAVLCPATIPAMVLAGAVGGGASAGFYGLTHTKDFSPIDCAAAFVGGALTGALSVVTGPFAGPALAPVCNFAFGAGAAQVEGLISGKNVTGTDMVISGAANFVCGEIFKGPKWEPKGFHGVGNAFALPGWKGLLGTNGSIIMKSAVVGAATGGEIIDAANKVSDWLNDNSTNQNFSYYEQPKCPDEQ
jgi:hypothetical protein